MTIDARLAQAKEQSVSLYLQRQEVEMQRQQVQARAVQIDAELLRLDGEIRALTDVLQPEGFTGTVSRLGA